MKIRESCGEICETRADRERVRRTRGVWSAELEKRVDCAALFSNPYIDADSDFEKPPQKVGSARHPFPHSPPTLPNQHLYRAFSDGLSEQVLK